MKNIASILSKFPEGSSRARIWTAAAIAAFSCHVAFATFALSYLREGPEDDDFGAPGIEISVELASPRLQSSDLPPGPESDASAASRAAIQQRTTKNPDLPKETVKDNAEADRQVTSSDIKTMNEDKPETKVLNASEESVAQKAAAAPSISNSVVAPKPTVHEQGTGQSRYRSRVTWQKELLAHLDKFKHYPGDRTGQSAEISISITLDREGRVISANIAKSSGDSVFDRAALAMIEKASPVPAPPPLIADEGLNFSLPVIFQKSSR